MRSCCITDLQTFDRLLHHLPERAQDRVRRFRHPDDAVRSLAARLLPTWYLREAGVVSPSEHPKFGVASRGKPYLLEPRAKVGFNTTHEGEYVLLAIGEGEVGVDVMDLPKDPQELEEGISFQVSATSFFEHTPIANVSSPKTSAWDCQPQAASSSRST